MVIKRTTTPRDQTPQPTIPHPTRSSVHRCLQRHGISGLPEVEGDKPEKKRFKPYPIGYFHVDIAQVSIEEGKLSLFVAIDRTGKFAFVRLVESAGKMETAQFLSDLIPAVPYRIRIVLTDNGIQFTNRKKDTYAFAHIFDRVCAENDIARRLTKVKHPWTNGQVERMNRTIKDATIKRYHYESHDPLRDHLQLFVDASNHARRLKTLSGLTLYERICQAWTRSPNASESIRHTTSRDRTPSSSIICGQGTALRPIGDGDGMRGPPLIPQLIQNGGCGLHVIDAANPRPSDLSCESGLLSLASSAEATVR